MPFYEYECSDCKFYAEVMQKISDAPLTKCPSCGKKALVKLISAPIFRLKGGGWYETDFKGDSEGRRNLAGSDDDSSAKTEAAGKPDSSKPEGAKVEASKTESAKADSSKAGAPGAGSSTSADSTTKSGESKTRPAKRQIAGRTAKPVVRTAASKVRPAPSRVKPKAKPARKKARR
jgi:putative FmdB family regulatory protein